MLHTVSWKVWYVLGSTSADSDKSHESNNSNTLKKLEQQYESSRYLTHVARGVGLGFGTTNTDNSDLAWLLTIGEIIFKNQ